MDDDSRINDNRMLWNARVPHHVASEFYDVESFVAGRDPLAPLELSILGDISGLDVLHLQCHFGQDTIALARRGARITGLDISEEALKAADALATRCGVDARWIQSDVRAFRPELEASADLVFSSYGTIGWIPALDQWAHNIARYLRPPAAGRSGGRFVFAEFHPVVYMLDEDSREFKYSYFNREVISEQESGTYANRDAPIELTSHGWNHSMADIIGSLLEAGLQLETLKEWDGSPHDCFRGGVRGEDGLYRIAAWAHKIPMVYGLVARRVR